VIYTFSCNKPLVNQLTSGFSFILLTEVTE